MMTSLRIAARELVSYFVSPIAYVVTVFFLVITGIIFTLTISQPGGMGGGPRAEIGGLAGTMAFLLLLSAPVITMRLFAEEKRLGTLELLMTSPVRDWQVVFGKWLGATGLVAFMLLVSIEYPVLVYVFAGSKPDIGPMVCAYIGLLLAGMAYTAVGTMVSSTTNSQVVAWIVSLVVLLVLWLIGWFEYAAASSSSNLTQVAVYVSINEHFRNVAEGVLTSKALLFFLSLTFFPLFLASRIVEGSRTQ